VQAIKTDSEIILTESVIDALSVMVAGFANVIAIQGTNGLKDSDIETLRRHGVSALCCCSMETMQGVKAAGKLRPRLEAAGLAVKVKALPADHDPNSYLTAHGAGALSRFLSSDARTASELQIQPEPELPDTAMRASDPGSQVPDVLNQARRTKHEATKHEEQGTKNEEPSTKNGDFVATYGLRTYQILGLEKGPRKLRATVRVQHAGKLHVDTLDFYSSRSRRMLAQDLCRILDESPETIEADISRLLQACEKAPEWQGRRPEVRGQPRRRCRRLKGGGGGFWQIPRPDRADPGRLRDLRPCRGGAQ
jgi:DNA primase